MSATFRAVSWRCLFACAQLAAPAFAQEKPAASDAPKQAAPTLAISHQGEPKAPVDIVVELQHSPPSDAKCAAEAGSCDAEHHWLVELQVAARKVGAGKPVRLAMTQVAEIEKELRSAADSKAEKSEAATVSEAKLSIRVPAQTRYALVQRLIGMAARSGIHRVEFAVTSAGTALEQRLTVPLPIPAKAEPKPEEPRGIEEIRVRLFARANGQVVRIVGNTAIANGVKGDEQLQALLKDSADGWKRLGRPDAPGVIDAGSGVPWQAIVSTIDVIRAAGVQNVQFAASAARK